MTSAAATDTRHIRDVLPHGLIRDLPGARAALPPPAAKKPTSSIKEAIVHWLNQEL